MEIDHATVKLSVWCAPGYDRMKARNLESLPGSVLVEVVLQPRDRQGIDYSVQRPQSGQPKQRAQPPAQWPPLHESSI